jgi:hypothetical protein
VKARLIVALLAVRGLIVSAVAADLPVISKDKQFNQTAVRLKTGVRLVKHGDLIHQQQALGLAIRETPTHVQQSASERQQLIARARTTTEQSERQRLIAVARANATLTVAKAAARVNQ